MNQKEEIFTTFSSICGCLPVVSEHVDEPPPVLDVLRNGEDMISFLVFFKY